MGSGLFSNSRHGGRKQIPLALAGANYSAVTTILFTRCSFTVILRFPYKHLSTFVRSASATTSFITKRSKCRTMVYACRICPNVDETLDSGSGISKRSFGHHKVSSSQIVRLLLGISAKEQAGVTTDLAQDPILVRRLCCSFPYMSRLLGTHQGCLPKLRS